MQTMFDLLPLVAVMLATGVVAGVMAGLLGVGGGIVIVPVLEAALGIMGVDPAIRMHVAVATSLASIVPTSIASSRAHHARGAVDFALARRWGPMIFLGSILGALAAAQVDSSVMATIFAVVALLVAIQMLLPMENVHLSDDIPQHLATPLIPTCIGGLSSMIGIGGGSLSVPSLTLMNQPIHRAVGTSALFGLLISLPGALGFVFTGWSDPRLPPGSLGYVNLIGLALIAPMTVWAAPVGVRIAHKLDKRQLNSLFGIFLFVVSCRMIYRALAV